MLTDLSPEDEADRLQAAYFCVELHCEIDDLEQRITKLRVALADQVAQRMPGERVRGTQKQLRDTLVHRGELVRMLDALGHRFPCRHHA